MAKWRQDQNNKIKKANCLGNCFPKIASNCLLFQLGSFFAKQSGTKSLKIASNCFPRNRPKNKFNVDFGLIFAPLPVISLRVSIRRRRSGHAARIPEAWKQEKIELLRCGVSAGLLACPTAHEKIGIYEYNSTPVRGHFARNFLPHFGGTDKP